MRNVALSTLICLIFIKCSSAQEFQLGAKAGLNLSTISANSETVNPRLAYHFGSFAQKSLSERLSINPEVLYFTIGHINNRNFERLSDTGSRVNTSFISVERANYLAVPINFRYSFTESFGLDFGPQASFLLNTTIKIKEGNNIGDGRDENTISGKFRPDYGVNLGLTFTPIEKINFQLRYYQGLNNLLGGSLFSADSGLYNVALQLSAGYVIF